MKKIPILFLIFGFIFLFNSVYTSITGAIIGGDDDIKNKLFFVIGMVFLAGSFILFNLKRGGLEYLVIPTGWEEDRIPKAKEELNKGKVDKIIITGHVDKGKVKGYHREKIYKAMRSYGVRPAEMKILDGIDSEEDVLYLGKILNKGDEVAFDTFPLHYAEYKTLINKAKRDGEFPKGIKIRNVKTRQGIKETLYGIAGWGEELFKRGGVEYVKDRKEGKFSGVYSSIKEGVKKLLR